MVLYLSFHILSETCWENTLILFTTNIQQKEKKLQTFGTELEFYNYMLTQMYSIWPNFHLVLVILSAVGPNIALQEYLKLLLSIKYVEYLITLPFLPVVHCSLPFQPVFLNEVMVKKPTEEDGDVFHLSHIDRVYNLRCHSQNDR